MSRRLDVEKKRPSRWPWLVGAILVALVLWGVSVLLRTPVEEEIVPAATTTEDTLPPAVIPSQGGPISSPTPAATDLSTLDEDAVGETGVVEGEVVATGNGAYWVLSGDHVLRVDSERRARSGERISVEGTFQPADPATTERMASDVLSRHEDFDSWTIIPSVKLVEEPTAAEDETPAPSD